MSGRIARRHLLAGLGQKMDWRIDAGDANLSPHPAAPVRQILLNLPLNASSASGAGGRLGLAVAAVDGGLAMTIRDE